MIPCETIYLDHASTTPVREEVLDAMKPYWTRHFGNAGSLHRLGREAKKAVDRAREEVALLINADPRDVIFTSGGTEANNLAVQGAALAGRKIFVSAVEHHSVLHAVKSVERVAVDDLGIVQCDELVSGLTDRAFVSVMLGNNETGSLQPVEVIGAHCRERGALLHTDAVQAAGKIPIDVVNMPVDLLSLSAHKLYGPKGVGALYVRRGIVLPRQMAGGSQERGRRAGTENVAGIVGFGTACALARKELDVESRRLRQLLEALEAAIQERLPHTWVNGARDERLPHILNIGFPGREGEEVMLGLDQAHIAVSTGSACTSGSVDASHVLLAMGQDHARAHAAVRFSLGKSTTLEHIDHVCDALTSILQRA